MMTKRALALTCGLALMNAGCAPRLASEAPAAAASLRDISARIGQVAQQAVDEGIVPGISVAVFSSKGVVGTASAGLRDVAAGLPVTAATNFEAASLSKTATAWITCGILKNHGLTTEARVNAIQPLAGLDDPRADVITFRTLLSHSSGLPNWRARPNLAAHRYSELFAPGQRPELAFAPGTAFRYSGEGFVYLQQIDEALSRRSFADLARERLFEPAGMRQSAFTFTATATDDYAKGYEAGSKDAARDERPFPLAAATLNTTATDYARFLSLLVRRGAEPPCEDMFTPQVEVASGDGYRVNWGLGVGIIEQAGKRYLFHWGDNGQFKAYYLFSPADDLGFVYFANGSDGLAIRDRFVTALLGRPVAMWPTDYQQR